MAHQIRQLVLAPILLLGMAGVANANVITNGTFDANLNDWDITGGPGALWDDGTGGPNNAGPGTGGEAWLGAPGPNGISTMSQIFNVTDGFGTASISFDWSFQVGSGSAPPPDLFTAEVEYWNEYTNTLTTALLFKKDDVLNPQSGSFLGNVKHVDWTKDLTIIFKLDEQENQPNPGTRVELDNVSAQSVPAPATLGLFGLALAGLGWTRRKKA
jgi:hypothetical protein